MMYEIRDITLRYEKKTVLDIPSLSVERGELVALLGPNGSGKTSLLKLLDGLLKPTGGRILREGKPLEPGKKNAPRSVYLHQFPYILSGSVRYNVSFGCTARNVPFNETRQRVADAMRMLGLEALEGKANRALSGGEAQRVALARALASGSDILLLDEPTASADVASTRLIEAAIAQMADQGTTIVFSTHDEQFAKRLTSRTIRLKEGRIEETGGVKL